MQIKSILALNTLLLTLLLINITGCEETTPATPTTKEYTVTFNPNQGTLAGAATVKVVTGKKVTQPQPPTRTGFSFVEWQNPDGTAFNFATETITANITLTANWRSSTGLVTYVVIFDPNNGVLAGNATVDVDDGQAVPEPADPTREGFTFVEWRTADGNAFDFATIITAGITLTAEWTMNAGAIMFTVTFDPNRGMLNDDAMVDVVENGTLATPQNPTRTGFTFIEWQNPDGTAFNFATETITANITLTASWIVTIYTVTFDPNGGMITGDATVEVTEGENIAPPQDPTRPEFSFVEWRTADGTAFNFATETITADITLTANWRSAGTVTAVALTANEMDDGYTVTYTYTNADGTGTGGTPEITWLVSDNPDGSDSTQVAMGMEVTHIPMGVNRYKHLAASVRVMSAEGAYTAAVTSTTVFPGFSKQASGTTGRFMPGRNNHAAVIFNNSMWVIGGFSNNGARNDVWSSADGITWTRATADAGFPARTDHTSVVFNNRIWVIGGSLRGTDRRNDVWSSIDGVTWTQATADATDTLFSTRSNHTSVVFNNRMWVIGGINDGFNSTNDVWSSTNGINWTAVRANRAMNGFPARYAHTSVVFNNRIWVIGGINRINGTVLSNVWSSTNGINWTEGTANAGFPARQNHTSVVFNNRIWVIGGRDQAAGMLNDVWSSTNGINWTQAKANRAMNGFTARDDFTSVVLNNRIWVIGGFTTDRSNDVWY